MHLSAALGEEGASEWKPGGGGHNKIDARLPHLALHNHTHGHHSHSHSLAAAQRAELIHAASHLIQNPGDLNGTAFASINGTYYMSGSSHGLSNRIGGVAAALYSATLKNITLVVFEWPTNNAYDEFYSIFEIIPRLIIIEPSLAPMYKAGAKFVSQCYKTESCWSMKWGVDPVHKYFDKSPEDFAQTTAHAYIPLQLSEENLKIVEAFVAKEGICKAHAIHIRRTDMVDFKTSDQDFLDFVASKPSNSKVFVLTDNNSTREWFREKIGQDRVITYGTIRGPAAGSLRHTSETMAFIEAMIASFAASFKGTVPSTFSEMVDIFRRVNVITNRRLKICGSAEKPF